ncbi:kinase-like domain-containing protein [Chytridium lagenaria]|nr:kinase-like domain-containing protein [Chytridium lagenaria]
MAMMMGEPIDYNGEVELRHFNLLRCVGRGAFGKVRIVEKRDTKKLYALKYINKLQCVRMRAIQNIFRERAILEEISHPLIVNLRFAFQDDENMFMVLDLMMGGDLRYHLDRIGGFTEPAVRLLAAEISAATAYLHQKNIVHRDLKPDNVLLDTEGHAHLTDFNIAVNYAERKTLKSHSGTHAYMGYLWQIDWWSLGIRPFRGQTNDAVTHSILHEDLCFSVLKAMLLYSGLLERDPARRLGVERWERRNFSHPWFAGMDWGAVGGKAIKPLLCLT